jgi:toxin YoeB
MRITFTQKGFSDDTYWQAQDRRALKRINDLIADAARNGYAGIGKPGQYGGHLVGWASKRMDERNRLVFRIVDDGIEVMSCRGHS